MTEFSPREIVSELDRFIIGQPDATRAVAIARRNRWRRQQLPDDLRDEVLPKNILMIGPTGVGKTEISRRLARLANAPFIKVEATKFTEVGYVGRDVEQIIQDVSLDLNQDGNLDACDDCVGDIDGSGSVEVNDVLLLLSSWGDCSPPCDADLNNDGSVDVNDVLMLLSLWGECP